MPTESDCLIITPDGRPVLDAEKFFAKPETIAKLRAMSEAMTAKDKAEQVASLAYGNLKLHRPDITLDQIRKLNSRETAEFNLSTNPNEDPMTPFQFPPDFNPATHRAYIGTDGQPVIAEIPPEVRMIPFIEPTDGSDPFAARKERAKELASMGHVIDAQIDVWGWGAENTMRLRRMYGHSRVPDAFGVTFILVPPAK
jgi:hypothetical protein